MAMLEKAKKASEEKDDKKKHKKHPAPKASPQPEEATGDADADESEGGGQDQPGSESDDSGAEDAPEGGAAPGGAPDQEEQQGGGEDQSDSQGADGQDGASQGMQQGGAQGATPVPSPAAPGAGDTTSGGEDTPDQDEGPETPGEDTAEGPGSENSLPQVPMSPGLKDEYDKANELLMQLLYKAGDDKLATGILGALIPQGPAKIKNAAMISITVITQLHKRMQLPAQLILPVAKDVVAHVLDLGQQVKQIQYSDQEATAIFGAVYESMLRIFGVTKGQVKTLAQHLGRSTLMAHQQKYAAAHAFAKPAMDANNAAWHHDHLAPQQDSGAAAGPQTGAPAGAQAPAPEQGQPPTPPAPPPTPAQGMLSQAAQGAQ